MVDFHNPAIVEDDFRTYIPGIRHRRSIELVFCSCGSKVLAHPGWNFHVSPSSPKQLSPPFIAARIISSPNHLFFSSWEFLGSLHYEWSVIRGHRPYRWTIWVCSAPLWVTFHRAHHLVLLIPLIRFIP